MRSAVNSKAGHDVGQSIHVGRENWHVQQLFKEMNLLQETLPRLRSRSCSMTHFNETDAMEEWCKGRPYQRRRSDTSSPQFKARYKWRIEA